MFALEIDIVLKGHVTCLFISLPWDKIYLVGSTKNLTKFLKVTQQIGSKMKHQTQGTPSPLVLDCLYIQLKDTKMSFSLEIYILKYL